jgi:chromosome segregation ATPase
VNDIEAARSAITDVLKVEHETPQAVVDAINALTDAALEENERLKEWQAGAKGAALLRHLPNRKGNTPGLFATHKRRYEDALLLGSQSQYAHGADLVSEIVLELKAAEARAEDALKVASAARDVAHDLEDKLEQAEADLAAARETNTRLNRRLSQAEGEIDDVGSQAKKLWLILPAKEGDVFDLAVKEITRLREFSLQKEVAKGGDACADEGRTVATLGATPPPSALYCPKCREDAGVDLDKRQYICPTHGAYKIHWQEHGDAP